MNEEVNWEEAPEGFDLHIKVTRGVYINSFAKKVRDGFARLLYGDYTVNLDLCILDGTVTERPYQEKEDEVEHSLMDEDSLQGQLSSIGNLLHNVSCSMEDEEHQSTLGKMVTELWRLSEVYKLTPEQRLRAKVWDTVAETDIRESDIDSITTDILEKFKLEEK